MKVPKHEGSTRLVGSKGPICKSYGEQMSQHVEYMEGGHESGSLVISVGDEEQEVIFRIICH